MAKKKNAETKPVAVQTNELVANCDHPLTIRQIEKMIFTIRGVGDARQRFGNVVRGWN